MAYFAILILKLGNLKKRGRLEMAWKLESGKLLTIMEIKDISKSKRKELELYAGMEQLP
jgi:hypothetical protein